MPVPCYGCGGTLAVDPRRPTQSLLVAGWTLEHGETYCPACRDPGAAEPVADSAPTPSPPAEEDIALWHEGTRQALERYRDRAPGAIISGGAILVLLGAVVAIRAAVAHTVVPGDWLRPMIMAGLLGAGLLVGGMTVRRRSTRWGVLLAGAAWEPVRLTFLPAPRQGGFTGLQLWPADAAPLLLRLDPVFKWRAAALRAADGETVWLAGAQGPGYVVALPPNPEPYPVASPTPRQLARYRKLAAERSERGRLTDFERRVAVRRAFRYVHVRAATLWLEASLLTLAGASLIGLMLVAAYSAALVETLRRARRARDAALGPSPTSTYSATTPV